jgi:DNA-binding NarL/FixJ family response regulator
MFSKRQAEVIPLVAKGYSDKQIAKATGIAPGTVKIHITAARAKIQAKTRLQLAVHYALHGLTGPPVVDYANGQAREEGRRLHGSLALQE